LTIKYLDAYIIGREKLIKFYHQVAPAYPEARQIYIENCAEKVGFSASRWAKSQM
jgi:hypothetical protein